MSKQASKSQARKRSPKATATKSVNQAATKPGQGSSIKFFLKLGILFLLAGGLLAYHPLMRRIQEQNTLATAPAPAPVRTPEVEAATKTSEKIEGKPTRMVIPSLDIDLSIADGIYHSQSQTWTLSNDKAHYALMTAQPNNQAGNTFIYGHNRPAVFARLSKLAVGQTVTIYTDTNRVFTYRYRSAYETNPNDSSVFSYQGPPILTLQTCSGLWYQNRYLMTFDLIGVI